MLVKNPGNASSWLSSTYSSLRFPQNFRLKGIDCTVNKLSVRIRTSSFDNRPIALGNCLRWLCLRDKILTFEQWNI